MREQYASLVTEEDRVNVAMGDVVVFDMDGFSEGEHLDNASGEGLQIEVGEGRFPDEFEKGIVGVTRGILPAGLLCRECHVRPEMMAVRGEVQALGVGRQKTAEVGLQVHTPAPL